MCLDHLATDPPTGIFCQSITKRRPEGLAIGCERLKHLEFLAASVVLDRTQRSESADTFVSSKTSKLNRAQRVRSVIRV